MARPEIVDVVRGSENLIQTVERNLLTHLIETEIDALLACCDRATWTGRSDHALLVLAIQTGLRISELTRLTCSDINPSTGTHLSRDAIEHRIARYTTTARENCPSLRTKHVTAHTLRHSAAMALLEAGMDVTVIALWFGHEQSSTPEIYLHADMSQKLTSNRPSHASRHKARPLPTPGHTPNLPGDPLIVPTSSGRIPYPASDPAPRSA